MVDLQEFCQTIFASMSRVDQRRAAQAYLSGLLRCPGRKSVRRLAGYAPGLSEQSLQRFIGRSPWDPVEIRRCLMAHLSAANRPVAWAIEEVVFPKHGRHSAAVGRQYVRSSGELRNCQLAVAVAVLTGQTGVPVNWRLMVPEEWGADTARRAHARLPDDAQPHPYWHYPIDAVDEMTRDWGMTAPPILVDASSHTGIETLLGALDHRRLRYLAKVNQDVSVSCTRPLPARAGTATTWRGTVRALADQAMDGYPEPSPPRSRSLRLPVRLLVEDGNGRPGRRPPRSLLCTWPPESPRPTGYWITNVFDRPLSELVTLADLGPVAGDCLTDLGERFGLRDYEGRTFDGWHHHVTLVAAAYTYHLLHR